MIANVFLEYLHLSKELLHVIAILVLAWLLMVTSRRLIHLFLNYMNTRADTFLSQFVVPHVSWGYVLILNKGRYDYSLPELWHFVQPMKLPCRRIS